MRQKRYFSSESAHGSESSHGFANDTVVLAFDSKQARDKYVERSRNISCRAIKASQATREAANVSLTSDHDGRPRPHKYECWIIRELDNSEKVPAACIGVLEIGSTWDDSATRFYR
jgi:hypothetical protein